MNLLGIVIPLSNLKRVTAGRNKLTPFKVVDFLAASFENKSRASGLFFVVS